MVMMMHIGISNVDMHIRMSISGVHIRFGFYLVPTQLVIKVHLSRQ